MSNWWDQYPDAQASSPSQSGNWWDKYPDARRQRSLVEEALRQGGLGVRYLAEGAAGVVAPLANAAGAAYNLSELTGLAGLPRTSTDLVGAVSGVLDRAGLPKPETGAENISSAVSKAIPSGYALSRGAAALPDAVRAAAPAIQQMAARPAAETLYSMVGGGAPEAVKQYGGNDTAQMIAGVVAAPAAQATLGGGRMAATAINESRRPITAKGQEQIAADVVGRLASNKSQAIDNLTRYAAAKELEMRGGPTVGVPGSRPTAGAVSADYGLIGGEQAISRGDAAPRFADQYAKNNQARIDHLSKLRATQEQLNAFTDRREQITGPLRERAFSEAKAPVNYVPVAERLGAIAATAEGGRAESRKALEWIAGRLTTYEQEGRVDPANAYALYKDIGDLVAGKVKDSNGSAIRLAGGLANEVKKALGAEISAVSPTFPKYLETYSRLSKPIDRLEKITQALGGRELANVTNAGVASDGRTPSYVLSQAKVKNRVQDLRNDPEIRLAPRQSDVLESVLGDLNAETLASRGGRQPGSDTYQNMASANFLARVLGQSLAESGASKPVGKALSWAYKPFGAESRIQDLIVQAYQDLELMRRLLAASRTSRASPTLVGSTPAITGGLFGYLAQ